MVELPVDVFFAIIEEIGMQRKPDFDLLWAFCSTCRTLRPHAQKFLFHSLSLDLTVSTPHPFDFAMGIFWEHMEFILDQNPHIGASVTYVRFRGESTTRISPRFATLLSKFITLKTLRCGYEEDYGVAWSHLRDSQRQIWRDIFRQPSVHHLQILDFDDIPVSLLFPCTSLRTLYLDDFASLGPPELQEHTEALPNLPLTKVESVQTTNYFSALDPIFAVHPSIGVPTVEKRHVKHLAVSGIADEDCPKLKDFSSLRSFNGDIPNIKDPRNLFDNFHAGSIQSLQSLGMEFEWDSEVTETYPDMALLAAAMATHPIFKSLTRVSISISFIWGRFGIEEPLAELDQLFASTIRFPRLRIVTIKLNADTESSKDDMVAFWVNDSKNIRRCLRLVAARSKCKLVPLVGLSS